MTDASTNVATIDHRPVQAAGISAAQRRTVDDAKEAAKTNGRTFADSMKEAEARPSDKSEEPAMASEGRKGKEASADRKAGLASKKAGSASKNAGFPDSRGSALKSSLKKSTLQTRRIVLKNLEVLKIDNVDDPEAAEAAVMHEAAAAEAPDVHAFVSGTMLQNTKTPATEANPNSRKSNTGNVKSASEGRNAAGTSITDKPDTADLSSRSGKVEVVDKREFGKVEGKITSSFSRQAKATAARSRGDSSAQTDAGSNSTSRVEGFTVAESEIELSPAGGKSATSRSAAAELAKKLDSESGSDIVRQVKVVLNRSNAGEVRINLRPDNLGRVRVRIQLEDNRLTGRIFVESAAAREAFRDAIDGLQTKLVEAGFGSADLELAWDESAQNFADGQGRDDNSKANTGQSAREFENTVPLAVADEAADGRINMVV